MNIKTDYENLKIKPFHTEETASTNDDAKSIALNGALVIADRQTGGKGRLGREFVSEKGGVYMSLFLDTETYDDTLFITSAAAVAASRAIDELSGKSSLIKWVNDVYLFGKKVCGILAEGVIENGKIKSAVLGIGVNLVKTVDFSGELKEKAGFIFETGDFNALREKFIDLFLREFLRLFFGGEKEEIYKAYKKKNYLSGKTVTFFENGRELSGKAEDIDRDTALLVNCDGEIHRLVFGEVNIKL